MQQDPKNDVASLLRGVRVDLVIAVSALLMSSLATAASWWQTRIIQQQLGAQVWPYVAISEDINDNTAQLHIENDGLGPAVLRSFSVSVDGKPVRDSIALMHAILGPHLVARKPRGETISLSLSSASSGSVLRVGESTVVFAIRSKTFAPPFMRAAPRVTTRICYCAIVPGTCWLTDSGTDREPQPLTACAPIPNDFLHTSLQITIDALNGKF